MHDTPGPPTDAGTDEIADEVRDDIAESLARTQSGELLLRFAGGEIRVSTNGTPWCAVVDDRELHTLAERLATIAEDPRMILALTDTGDFLAEKPDKLARRSIELRRSSAPGSEDQGPTTES